MELTGLEGILIFSGGHTTRGSESSYNRESYNGACSPVHAQAPACVVHSVGMPFERGAGSVLTGYSIEFQPKRTWWSSSELPRRHVLAPDPYVSIRLASVLGRTH